MVLLRSRALALGTALSIVWGLSAHAQQAAPVQLGTVVVQGNVEGNRPSTGTVGQPPAPYAGGQVGSGARLGILGNKTFRDTPFNVSSYTDKLIRDQQAKSVADVALNDPSVRSDAPIFSERDSFFIRGFSVVNLDVSFDGLSYIANPRRSFLEGVERVEILKGPSTLISGGIGRVGGTINLVPKRATDAPITRLTTTYSSDAQGMAHVDFGRRFGPAGEWGVRANGSFRKGDTALENNEIEVGVGALGLDYRGERLRASVDINYSKQEIDAPTSLFNAAAPGIAIPKAPDGSINTANPWEYIDSSHRMIAGRVEYDVFDETTIYAAGGLGRYREDFLTSSYTINDAAGNATAALGFQPQQIDGLTGEIGVRSKFETGPVGHEISLSYAKAINKNYRGGFARFSLPSFATNIYNPSYLPAGTVNTSGFPLASGRPLFAEVELDSVALVDTLFFLDDRFQLTLGGRYQSVQSRGYSTALGPTLGDLTYDYDKGRFSPAVAAVARLTDNLSIYGNYVEALTEGPSAPARAANANELFAPVVNEQKEVGVKYEWGTLGFTASLFEIRQPNGFTDPVSNVFSVAGRQVNRGLELNVFGEPIQGVRLLGGVAFMDAELKKTVNGTFDGNTAPGVPDAYLTLYGEYDMPWLVEGITATGRVIHSGSTWYDQANTQKVDDWTRVDLGLRYAFTGPHDKPVEIRAAVENVFNENYWASSARGFLAAGAPRSFVLSASFDF